MAKKALLAGVLLSAAAILLGFALRDHGTILALLPTPTVAEEVPGSGEAMFIGPPETVVGRAGRVWSELKDFEATATIENAEGAVLTEARLWFAKPNRWRLQMVRPAAEAGEGTTLAFDGTRLWIYAPAEQQVVVVEGPAQAVLLARFLAPPLLPAPAFLELASFMQSLPARDDARVLGEEVPAGHRATLVEVGPNRQQLWLAEDSGLPYQLSFDTVAGTRRLNLRFSELAIDVGLADRLFHLEVPAGAQVMKADLPLLASRLGWWSPPTPELAGTPYRVLLPSAAAPAPGMPALYVALLGEQRAAIAPLAGETYLLENSTSAPIADLPGQGVTLSDGTAAYRLQVGSVTMLTWERSGTRLTLIGEVTPERALALANGLPPP